MPLANVAAAELAQEIKTDVCPQINLTPWSGENGPSDVVGRALIAAHTANVDAHIQLHYYI